MLLAIGEYATLALAVATVGTVVSESTATATLYSLLATVTSAPQLADGEAPPKGLVVAFVLCLSATALTIMQIAGHLTHYYNPTSQRYVVRILLMVPIYAIDSFWGYLDYSESSAIAVARDTYESYVLYNFFCLLMEMLGGVSGCVAYWKAHKMETMPHGFPMNYVLKDMTLDAGVLGTWKLMLVQYMILSPLMTLCTYLLTFEGLFDENSYAVDNAHLYVSLLRGTSVTFAFTSLFYLYLATKHHIHDLGPTGKFISIKFVVFLGFWQGIVVWILGIYNFLPSNFKETLLEWSHNKSATEEDAELAFGNLLLCVEMLITAIMHHFVFSYRDYLPPAKGSDGVNNAQAGDLMKNAAHAFSVLDVAKDAKSTAAAAKKRQ